MWICPACGAWSVERFLEGKGPKARAGAYDGAPAKTRVAFRTRTRFASVNALSERGMRFHLLLRRRIDDRRLARVEKIGGWWVHHFRVERAGDLVDRVARLVAEARRVTQGAASR